MSRTGMDNGAGAAPETWGPIARRFASAVEHWYVEQGYDPRAPAAQTTLRLNSVAIPGRVDPIVALLAHKGRLLAGARVLEVGCGFGALATYLAWRGRPRKLDAVDLRPDMITVARAGSEGTGVDDVLDFAVADMRDLRCFPVSSFDVAIANNSLPYLVDPADLDSALRELHRVLVPGGHVLTYQANRWRAREPFSRQPLLHLLPRRLGRALARRRRGWEPGRVWVISPVELGRRLRRAGFSDVTVMALRKPPDRGLRRFFLSYYAVIGQRGGRGEASE